MDGTSEVDASVIGPLGWVALSLESGDAESKLVAVCC